MLYAIGDLHLSFSVPKKMDVFGGDWKNYEAKIEENLSKLTAEDTVVLCGDTSWGKNLGEALADFLFLEQFPCCKILLKGNHDYFWETERKMTHFFAGNALKTFQILHNNAYFVEGIPICGTRGWFFEEERGTAHDEKIMNREVGRLRTSLEAATKRAPGVPPVVFLHYPPISNGYACAPILALLHTFGVEHCYYGHLHSKAHRIAVQGEVDGVCYHLIAGDFLGFVPTIVCNKPAMIDHAL